MIICCVYAGLPDISLLNSIGEVLSVRDVAQDTVHSFMPAYQVIRRCCAFVVHFIVYHFFFSILKEYILTKPYEEAPTKTVRGQRYFDCIINNLENII
jgi:hypothetical protein